MRRGLGDQVNHRSAGGHRITEVAGEQPAEGGEVLLKQRFIHAHLLADLLNLRLGQAQGRVRVAGGDAVGRQRGQQEKGQRVGQQQDDKRLPDAIEHEFAHQLSSSRSMYTE